MQSVSVRTVYVVYVRCGVLFLFQGDLCCHPDAWEETSVEHVTTKTCGLSFIGFTLCEQHRTLVRWWDACAWTWFGLAARAVLLACVCGLVVRIRGFLRFLVLRWSGIINMENF